MLKNENIICISSIDWDFIWQGHQEIMATLAQKGNRVLFIENTGIRAPNFKDLPRLKKRYLNWIKNVKGFREELENLFVYSPMIIPFPYSRTVRWINKILLLNSLRKWMNAMDFSNPIIWTFLPTGIALDIINNIDKKMLLYYCVADFYELVGKAKKVKKSEDELIKKCDLIFAQGNFLEEKCKRLNENVYIFPFGVKIETFENFSQSSEDIPADIRSLKKPIIGYIGGIHKHIDLGLLKFIAEKHPEWSIALIGPLQTNTTEINKLDNIYFLGKKEFPDLPRYISQFDTAIIPYVKSRYTETVYPTKLNEYHAMGIPVVSTDLPEIASFNTENDNLISIASTYEEFADFLSHSISNNNKELINLRKASAKRNSWTKRIIQLSALIEESLNKKAKMPIEWQERFLRFYRLNRRKLFRYFAIAASVYLLLFYTPLIWLIGHPLKIEQSPQKADVIVVFAGGVGETGSPGKSTMERARYSVELFNEGYSDTIIYSSGYRYKYTDASNMKQFALSLGITEENIILEQNANSAYENVKYTTDILRKNGYDNILLISSPYNMRRAQLVYKNIAQDIDVTYTPVPDPEFFHRKKSVKLSQIQAILHEYLSILYYWLRGKI